MLCVFVRYNLMTFIFFLTYRYSSIPVGEIRENSYRHSFETIYHQEATLGLVIQRSRQCLVLPSNRLKFHLASLTL